MSSLHKPFVFLDTGTPDRKNRYSYLFYQPLEVLSTRCYEEMPNFLRRIETVAKHSWTAGYIAYEAAYGLEPSFASLLEFKQESGADLLWFGVFDRPFIFDNRLGTWDREIPREMAVLFAAITGTQDAAALSGCTIKTAIDSDQYAKDIHEIRRRIEAGDTYQVNYSFDLSLETSASPEMLYHRLRDAQKTPFCAYIDTGHRHVLSYSPELFFRKQGRRITTRPMKGTAPRGRFIEEDNSIKKRLKGSLKDRAENIMIVDLMRNDLGRICETGSVAAKSLFEVETYQTVYQMTSTVEGRLKKGIGLPDILRAVFPSGSVTGAPKIRTMQIIRALEKGERGVYCGALGFTSPSGRAVFNVPIRTLEKAKDTKVWKHRVGGGIVWDSSPKNEWRECTVKSRFLSCEGGEDFEMFETILWAQGFRLLKEHKKRLKKSCCYFNYHFSNAGFDSLCTEIEDALEHSPPCKVRIYNSKDGTLRWDHTPLKSGTSSSHARASLSPFPVDGDNPFLFHKTTRRPWYDSAMELIQQGKYDEVIFYNEKGEITEGSISNIFIEKQGRLFTPPVTSGLLPGVLRNGLIASGICTEKTLTLHDLTTADALYCGNSVRGLRRVKLI